MTASYGLFDLDETIDRQDPREKELLIGYDFTKHLRSNRSDGDFMGLLHERIGDNAEKVYNGLLYSILTDAQSQRYLKLLGLVVTDHFRHVISKLHSLVDDADLVRCRPFRRLRPYARAKIMDIVSHIAEVHVESLQSLLIALIRQIKGSDYSPENIALAKSIITILGKHWQRIPPNSDLIPVSVFSFLRLIADHSKETTLRQLEVDYVCLMLRNRFRDCARIGRDLLRVIVAVSQIPQIDGIVNDMFNAPRQLDPVLDVRQILATQTPPFVIAQRVTPEMDIKMRFILDRVKSSVRKTALSNFRTTLLSGAAPQTESGELIFADVIRFICASIQPPNHILDSNIVQRWEVVLFLLGQIRDPVALQDAKLTLFFDWLCWTAGDNIMYIEPGMLLIEKGAQASGDRTIAADLIEFLSIMVDRWLPPYAVEMRENMNAAMGLLLLHKVTPSLKRLHEINGWDEVTVRQWKSLFPRLAGVEERTTIGPSRAVTVAVQEPPQPPTKPPVPAPPSAPKSDITPQDHFLQLITKANSAPSHIASPVYRAIVEMFAESPGLATRACTDALLPIRTSALLEHIVHVYTHSTSATAKDQLLNLMQMPWKHTESSAVLCAQVLSSFTPPYQTFYRALATHLQTPFAEQLLQDLQVLHEEKTDEFYATLLRNACRVFAKECHGNKALMGLVLGLMDFAIARDLCDALFKREFLLFGTADLTELFRHSVSEWDEITNTFLWKLIIAEKRGRQQEIDEICRVLATIDIAASPSTTDALATLLLTTFPTAQQIRTAASQQGVNGKMIVQGWLAIVDRAAFLELLRHMEREESASVMDRIREYL
ncbi:protein-domain-containing protein [Fimicolochytrium jonesii]|uniref:protein-domain-containing protein n=1 Tax=Fimicolochytrium jonesii TaxID=1396493 RepID=UPI0022FDBD83|nr:protein-domain-containing protein [Fimicolochytrium jonesii]KAI8825177.1 protein-domain-containing protein [Fimicolochytrium jonesii]